MVLGAGAVSWLSARLRRAAVLVGCWRQSAPALVSADCTCCGGAVSWLCRLRTFLFQPVACQQVMGFCLAIWGYAGVILLLWRPQSKLSWRALSGGESWRRNETPSETAVLPTDTIEAPILRITCRRLLLCENWRTFVPESSCICIACCI